MEMMFSFLLEVGPILVLSDEMHPSVVRVFWRCRIHYLSPRRRSPPEEGSSSQTGCWGMRVTARRGQDLWGPRLASRGLQRTVCAQHLITWAPIRRTQVRAAAWLAEDGHMLLVGPWDEEVMDYFSLSTNLPWNIFWQMTVGDFIKCQRKCSLRILDRVQAEGRGGNGSSCHKHLWPRRDSSIFPVREPRALS